MVNTKEGRGAGGGDSGNGRHLMKQEDVELEGVIIPTEMSKQSPQMKQNFLTLKWKISGSWGEGGWGMLDGECGG